MFSLFKKEVKLVCFDIDNTLCDSRSAETEAEAYIIELIAKDINAMQSKNKMRSRNDPHSKTADKNNAKFGSCSSFTLMMIFNEVKHSHLSHDTLPEKYSRELWFKEMFERLDADSNLGISVNSLMSNSEDYERRYWEYFTKRLDNYPNTISTLKTLKSRGMKLASISDSDGKPGIKAGRIKALGLDKYFDYIITGDDTGFNKPAVENWSKLLGLSGMKAKQCMMVGDHPDIDLVTAKKLGFITVWTKQSLNNDSRHDYVDYEIKDIKEILDLLEKISK